MSPRLINVLFTGFVSLSSAAAFAEEGPAERAGRKTDEAGREAKSDAKRAGRATKRGAKKAKHKTGEKMEDAGDKMRKD